MNALTVAPQGEFPTVSDEPTDAAVTREYLVVLERGDTSWGAYAPDLPGVIAAGESEAEVRQLMAEAVAFHLEGLRDSADDIPVPTAVAMWVSA